MSDLGKYVRRAALVGSIATALVALSPGVAKNIEPPASSQGIEKRLEQRQRKSLRNYLAEAAGGVAYAFERNPNGYPIPEVPNRDPDEIKYVPGEGRLTGKLITIERFRLPDGKVIAKVRLEDKVYAYGFAGGSFENSYGLRDNDGDGIFREKYRYDERISPPQWLINLKGAQK